MAIWIQSLSWTLIYSLAQGVAVYTALCLVFKAIPATSSNARYHLSLSALTILQVWFIATWWQQFQSFTLANQQLLTASTNGTTIFWLPPPPISPTSVLSDLQALHAYLNIFSPWLFSFYVIGLVLMLARLSAGIFQLFSLKNSKTFQPDTALIELLTTQTKRIQLNRSVKLLISAKAQVPMVVGFIKPVILMPLAAVAQLDSKQLETILLHELAHIKRHDYFINMLQTIVETILFFNPFVWIISSITRREREHSCDDLVVYHTTEPISYASALVALAARRPAAPLIVVAATGQSNQLFNRIQRIMEMKKNTFSYSRMVATIIIISIITASIAWVKPTFLKTKKKSTVATATSTAQQVANTDMPNKEGTDPLTKTKHNSEAQHTPAATPPTSEENTLMYRLMTDKLVDQFKGFVVEKKQNQLYINGQLMTDQIAAKYLVDLKKELIRIQIFSFEERTRMHPNASFIQLLLPATFSSGCIDTRPVKEGC